MPILLALIPLTESLAQRPLLAAVTLFGAGVVTSLTPCVYPMIPITAGLLAGTSEREITPRRRVVGLTLSYVVGLALFYAVLGVIAGLTGSLFGTVSSSPWARGAIALKVDGRADPVFGAMWMTATVDVDRDSGMVWLHDLKVTRVRWPDASRCMVSRITGISGASRSICGPCSPSGLAFALSSRAAMA